MTIVTRTGKGSELTWAELDGNFTYLQTVGTWTPTITAQSGTFNVVSATGSYVQIGKLVTVHIEITITDKGTAGTAVFASLPNGWMPNRFTGQGREQNLTGALLLVYSYGEGLFRVQKYDSTYIGANGHLLCVDATFFV